MHLYTKHLRLPIILSALLAVFLFTLTYVLGNRDAFLLLNGDGGKFADYFFAIVTELGNGALWAVIAVWFYYKRKRFFPLALYTFLTSTVITQIFKYFIIPDEPRPSKAITDAAYHFVESVELHTVSSFPSGHSATAFCIYFLLVLVYPHKWLMYAGFIYGIIVGYSRVYLAQHFPLDIAGGITVAIASILISVALFKRFNSSKRIS